MFLIVSKLALVCLFVTAIYTYFVNTLSKRRETRLIGFMDFEKAFDYAKRVNIVLTLSVPGYLRASNNQGLLLEHPPTPPPPVHIGSKLINDGCGCGKLINDGCGCGKQFTKAVSKMCKSTTHTPLVGKNKIGDEILTLYGVTEGRFTSLNFYSFYVADMRDCTIELPNEDFMDPYNIVQLADDTAILAEQLISLKSKFISVFNYSKMKYQVANIDKTVYCNLSILQ